MDLRVCLVCGKSYIIGHQFTCSEECHKKLMKHVVKLFGDHKKVVDAETGKAYRVPTKDIMLQAMFYKDLIKYPEWE